MIRELLEHGSPERLAVVIPGGPAASYDALRRQVEALAGELRRLGLGRGDRIAMALPNGLEMVASFLAATQVGVAAPLNPAYTVDEFRFYLSDTGARALILPAGGGSNARAAGPGTLLIEASLTAEGQVRYAAVGRAQGGRFAGAPVASDTALVLHTSGTTSRPKRVPLAHAHLTASARTVAATYRLTADDVSLCVMPLFHVHGLVASTLATLAAGGAAVVVPRFNALSFWPVVREHGATWYSAVPTIHHMLLARTSAGAKPRGSEQLRFIRSCSAPLPAAMMSDMEERFGVPVVEAYGMTEAAHHLASNPLPPGVRKPGSVGRGTGVEIAILDEAGGLLPVGTRGEVAIKGPNVFGGYEGNEAANAESFVDGWFRTGDEGYLDGEQYLTLVGRIKEQINRGGEKISPREVDEALLAHPAVGEAVCYGVPDRIYGEEVAAAVVLTSAVTEAELLAHCRSLLADFKCPKVVRIVATIPRTATGKVQRRMVAAEIEGASRGTL